MANMTPQEQLMLELINRARMDPNAEAARYGIALNEGKPGMVGAPLEALRGPAGEPAGAKDVLDGELLVAA